MSNVKGFPISADELAMVEELWAVVMKHKDRIKPAEAIALLAQTIGAIVGGANITWKDDDQLGDLISHNVDAGYDAMKASLNEGAGHA